jgi:23S rRNA (guanosine2251-2'-O)-methyltransferase
VSRLVCGLQPVREAIRVHGPRLELVAVDVDRRGESPQLEALARFARDRGALVHELPRAGLDKIARGVRHQGAIALAPELAIRPLEDVPMKADALVVALDEVQDPQNFGAVIRSAVAMGATAVVWPEHRSAPLSPATFRASAGAVEHATLCRVPSLPGALDVLRSRGVVTVGLDASASTAIHRAELHGPVALIVGAEGKGLRKVVKHACTALVRLPMQGPIESLNASAAAAIALYETLRQREGALKGAPLS